MANLATTNGAAEKALIMNDLSGLTEPERINYYNAVCESLGLNALTQPFGYIKLNGALKLYAKREASDQIRKLHGVSIDKPDIQYEEDLIIVTVQARDKTGRTDAEIGVVSLAGLKGEARANAIMKAITKAKRRVTLSICGLGYLDETEVETIPAAEVVQPVDPMRAELMAQVLKLVNELGWSRKRASDFLKAEFGKATREELTTSELQSAIDLLKIHAMPDRSDEYGLVAEASLV